MPSITVNDHDGQQLLSVNLSQSSGLRRYLRAALGLRSFVPSRRDLGAALTDHADKGRDIDFAVERPIELDVVTLQLAAGGRVGVAVHGPEAVVIPGSDIRPSVLAPAGTAVMSCALRAVISAGAATPGATKLGFNAGTGLTLAYHHPFDLSGPEPTAGEALKTTLEAAGPARGCRGSLAHGGRRHRVDLRRGPHRGVGVGDDVGARQSARDAGPAAGGKPGREGQRDGHGRRPVAAERALRAPGDEALEDAGAARVLQADEAGPDDQRRRPAPASAPRCATPSSSRCS